MVGGMPFTRLRDAIYTHPTISARAKEPEVSRA